MNNSRLWNIVLAIISVMAVLFCPILAIIPSFLGIVFSEGKIRKFFSLLMAISLALVAYIWTPDSTMDLFRHHEEVALMSNYNVNGLTKLIGNDFEPAHHLIGFLIAQTSKVDLLQFFVILCGYFEVFWMICDYTESRKLKKTSFVLIFLYVISSVKFIDFASGLWCNFAIINLALGIYLNYFRNAKYIQYVFYALAACLHTGTLYVVVIVLLLSKVRLFRKTRLSTGLILFGGIMAFGGIVVLINEIFGADFPLVSIINRMYEGYFVNGNQFESLHTGWNLVIPVINILFSIFMTMRRFNNEALDKYRSLVLYTSICLLASIFNAGVFVRFSFLISIMMLPILCEYLGGIGYAKKRSLAIACMILIITSIQVIRSCDQIVSSGLYGQIEDNITNGIVDIIENQGGSY